MCRGLSTCGQASPPRLCNRPRTKRQSKSHSNGRPQGTVCPRRWPERRQTSHPCWHGAPPLTQWEEDRGAANPTGLLLGPAAQNRSPLSLASPNGKKGDAKLEPKVATSLALQTTHVSHHSETLHQPTLQHCEVTNNMHIYQQNMNQQSVGPSLIVRAATLDHLIQDVFGLEEACLPLLVGVEAANVVDWALLPATMPCFLQLQHKRHSHGNQVFIHAHTQILTNLKNDQWKVQVLILAFRMIAAIGAENIVILCLKRCLYVKFIYWNPGACHLWSETTMALQTVRIQASRCPTSWSSWSSTCLVGAQSSSTWVESAKLISGNLQAEHSTRNTTIWNGSMIFL